MKYKLSNYESYFKVKVAVIQLNLSLMVWSLRL